MKNTYKYICLVAMLIGFTSCEKLLEVTPNSEFSPGNILTTEEGIKSLLFSAYAHQQTQTGSKLTINTSEVCTDMAFNSGGAENATLLPIINFTWNSDLITFREDVWAPNYRSIRDANDVVENIDDVNTSDEKKKLYKAEARVLRAYAYTVLYSWFGRVPLRISNSQPGDLARATDEEMRTFIETEITESIADLPDPGQEEAYGRINKGNASGILAKFYLNTKQWQKAADAALAVINFNYYTTTQYEFKDLFKIENELNNREMLFVLPCINETGGFGNWYMAGALPSGFKSTPQIPEFVYVGSMANFATQYRLRTAFVNSMAPNDKRRSLICTSYINNNNVTVNILNDDNARSFKYWDNTTVGNNGGSDVPLLRYADILLTRAEALNELSTTPPTECFTLINQVRTRAGLEGLTIANTPSKEDFRDAIFRERGWEFISEGKRREDLIRQGTFLSSAIARGVSPDLATPDKLLFPIPQIEVEANKLLDPSN
ncbi:RagB/SusD family nutrient uptake outer membrane protein [Sphingobacterium sp. DN00404]|uniref:RagB/SusD family nutrient uptake outer membrane protein n=1 Tax=Sphingobacterium micropteri TaxID=2763501 RepID=A0ABR7YPK6_9SPHI|nr:RagB/SusD family nutrient uptake outer membrane protein [Sphingobacterium micropteri]MBD1433268.1 RagB/SusD family nutrient uptake outer membrane protein [Sphingobacterium micropteri]